MAGPRLMSPVLFQNARMAGKVQHAHIHRDHAAIGILCQGADAAAAFRKGGGDFRGHAAVTLGHAPGDHPVIRAEDQQAAVLEAHVGAALQGGKPCNRLFKEAEAAEGLGKAVPLPLRRLPRPLVRRRDVFDYITELFHFSHAFTKRSARGVSPPKCRCGKAA